MKKAKKFWTKLFGFKVGDRVVVQGKTKVMHATIESFMTVVDWRGNVGIEIPSAVVNYDGKIRRTQIIPLEKLELE